MPSGELRDTIAALATPPGRGGIGIVRVSGPSVPAIAAALLGKLPQARQALLSAFRDAHGEQVDEGIALYFPAPHSYTGEAVLELQGHGGPVVAHAVLRAVLDAGARLAEPGPSARISGTEPMTAANAVMITGRKRMRDASTMASLNANPWSRN